MRLYLVFSILKRTIYNNNNKTVENWNSKTFMHEIYNIYVQYTYMHTYFVDNACAYVWDSHYDYYVECINI